MFSKSNDLKDLIISDKEKFLNKFNKEALTILNRSIREKSTYSFQEHDVKEELKIISLKNLKKVTRISNFYSF